MKKLHSMRCALLSGAAILAVATPALALDAQDFADKIEAIYTVAGYDLQFGEGSVDGDAITFDGVTVKIVGVGDEAAEPFVVDTELTFSGVVENEDGSYFADELTVPDVDVEEQGSHVTIANIAISDVYVPASAEGGMMAMMQTFGAFSAGPLTVDVEGTQVLAIESMGASSTFSPEQGVEALDSVTGEAFADGISIDLSTVPEPEAKAMIDMLGLTTLTGSAREAMDWSFEDGRMTVSEGSVTFDQIGKIDFTFDILGYTADLMTEMMTTQAEMADMMAEGNVEGQAQIEQAFTAKMASALSLAGVSVRFDDNDFTGKVLDLFAQQQGLKREDFVAGLQVLVPAMLADFGDLPIVKEATDAAVAFFNDPQSLEVSVEPAEPKTIAELMAASGDINGLIDMLGVSVTAND